uniref:Uncharacterized protein n=1 Tax=Salix viminalis TaxID=40686 RepID=A0A6N2NF16_SALVM
MDLSTSRAAIMKAEVWNCKLNRLGDEQICYKSNCKLNSQVPLILPHTSATVIPNWISLEWSTLCFNPRTESTQLRPWECFERNQETLCQRRQVKT